MAVSEQRITRMVNERRWHVMDRTEGRGEDASRFVGAGTWVGGCHYGAEFELLEPQRPDELVERAKRRTAERLIEEGIV